MRKDKSHRSKIVSGRHIFAVLIAVFAIAGGIAAYHLITTERDYSAARTEYRKLRMYVPPPAASSVVTDAEAGDNEAPGSVQAAVIEAMHHLKAINPDFIGWIRINGTDIDYPVVQGTDNDKYLTTTFTGESNPSGTIFMDAECKSGFTFFSVLHGHNMRDGSMFAGLHNFLNGYFRTMHSEITIFSPDDGVLVFDVFAVKVTNIHDELFDLPLKDLNSKARYFNEFGFTLENLQESIDILVLATCTDGHRDERLLVFAARNRD